MDEINETLNDYQDQYDNLINTAIGEKKLEELSLNELRDLGDSLYRFEKEVTDFQYVANVDSIMSEDYDAIIQRSDEMIDNAKKQREQVEEVLKQKKEMITSKTSEKKRKKEEVSRLETILNGLPDTQDVAQSKADLSNLIEEKNQEIEQIDKEIEAIREGGSLDDIMRQINESPINARAADAPRPDQTRTTTPRPGQGDEPPAEEQNQTRTNTANPTGTAATDGGDGEPPAEETPQEETQSQSDAPSGENPQDGGAAASEDDQTETFEPNSIGDLMNRGIIPKHLTMQQISKICRKLNIIPRNRSVDKEFVVEDGKLDRLINDNDLELARNEQEIRSTLVEGEGLFGGLLVDYQQMQGMAVAQDGVWKKNVDSFVKGMSKENNDYEATLKGMQDNGILEELDLSERTQNKVDDLDDKKSDISEKLRAEYKKLDKELAIQKKKNPVRKFFSKIRQHGIESKIERFSKKEAKINGKKLEIMTTEAQKYMEQKAKEFERRQKEQKKMQAKIEKADELKREHEAVQAAQKDYAKNLRDKDVKGVERAALKVGKKILDVRCKRLESKRSKVDVRQTLSVSRQTRQVGFPAKLVQFGQAMGQAIANVSQTADGPTMSRAA